MPSEESKSGFEIRNTEREEILLGRDRRIPQEHEGKRRYDGQKETLQSADRRSVVVERVLLHHVREQRPL